MRRPPSLLGLGGLGLYVVLSVSLRLVGAVHVVRQGGVGAALVVGSLPILLAAVSPVHDVVATAAVLHVLLKDISYSMSGSGKCQVAFHSSFQSRYVSIWQVECQ